MPRRCGIATFTSDLMAAIRTSDPATTGWAAAINEPNVVRPYGPDVHWRIRQGEASSYRAAALAINSSKVDVVNVQHEFGLYGVWREGARADGGYTDHLAGFLEDLRKPVVTTLHSVPQHPSASMRRAVAAIAGLSDEVVVMARTAVQVLATDYGVARPPLVIPHGMPAIEPRGRRRTKGRLGVEGRTIISTFGLVDPRKGLEFMIEAMPAVTAAHPSALYLIAGQTHPDLLRKDGESYRNRLVARVNELGLADHVSFLNQYLDQPHIIELLLATDAYVTPYLDPQQITSGTLAYALGAGKAIISTAYLHAAEALAGGRGILVPFRDSAALAEAVGSVLADPARKASLESRAFEYAKDMSWPILGRRWSRLMREVIDSRRESGRLLQADGRPLRGPGRRLTENPLLTSANVPPSHPSLEVVSVFNAAAAQVGDETVLLLRVGERPRVISGPVVGARTLDLDDPSLPLRALPDGTDGASLVGVLLRDAAADPPRMVTAYLPRATPGLDLSDPRMIRYMGAEGGAGATSDHRDLLTLASHLRVARSPDGVHFEVDPLPAIAPAGALEEYGCEDPRATLIDGVWHITYVSVGRVGITTSLATTTDFRSFRRRGVIFLPDHKDVALFPGRVGGRFAALTRPMPQSFDHVLGIWIAFSDDLLNWGGHMPLALPRPGMWDEQRTGASAVPFRVAEGWLELYHGVDRHDRYAMGALLIDADDPGRVLARSAAPILAPEAAFERTGLFNDTVFSCGHVALPGPGERIRMYYGAADSCMAAADFDVREIVAGLEAC